MTLDGKTFFARVISYSCKMFMKLTTGVNIIQPFFFIIALEFNKLDCLSLTHLVRCLPVRLEQTRAQPIFALCLTLKYFTTLKI
jgi:hypothetical protein